MNKLLLLLILISAFFLRPSAQTYNMSSGTVTTCTGTYYDSGGPAAAYANKEAKTMTFCPTTATDYLIITFTSFALDVNFDFLYVYDGPTTASPLIGTYTAASPGTISSSTAGGCLTFKFTSDPSITAAGWAATISCSPTKPTKPNQDCIYKKAVCGTTVLNDNNNGLGAVSDLTASNEGCFAGEHQSSWYLLTIGTSGTLDFVINPAFNCDDYDFAIWGPNPACPPTAGPIRCSVACHSCTNTCGTVGTNNGTATPKTGLSSTATATSEASGSTVGYVKEMNVLAGETYILMVDNSQTNNGNNSFTLTFSGTATLTNCPSAVPIELFSISAKENKGKVQINWITASEHNADYFKIERSEDGENFLPIDLTVQAAGNSSTDRFYNVVDGEPLPGRNYYRLRQVDFNGDVHFSQITSVNVGSTETVIRRIYPSPSSVGNSINVDIFSVEKAPVEFSISDLTGKKVLYFQSSTDKGLNKIQLPTQGLAKGMYFIRVDQKGSSSLQEKLLIE